MNGITATRRARALCAAAIAAAASIGAVAAPIEPSSDDEVVETLPAAHARADDRRLRRQLAQAPRDAALAVRVAKRYLERARESGDPRYAGQAVAALTPWEGDDAAPTEVVVMQATLEQHLHDFDGAAARLERVVARDPGHAQAWLTLATLRRVQGRYAASDAACAGLARTGRSPLYALGCRSENDALRGRVDAARTALQQAIESARADAGARAWLLTTLAELEQRAGRPAAAEASFRSALAAQPDLYTALAYADLLIEQRRFGEVAPLLARWPRSDPLVLRLALADPRGPAAAEMRDRIAQANERPGLSQLHGREQAMFELHVEARPKRALELARENARAQREPLDLLVFAQAARAAGDAGALAQVRALQREIGLHDSRIDALL